ncbi:hypothetical protein DSLASN_23520 [Desulfoluna limicola]|uniref:Uncharacterized protein n=1 Tax=Desulfoluna limicola TaxID=2810562 RepID=A0ABM7PHF3_9BACT|nr:hypothetical protein DSLASN_23520 [Desulfoluna limicola]
MAKVSRVYVVLFGKVRFSRLARDASRDIRCAFMATGHPLCGDALRCDIRLAMCEPEMNLHALRIDMGGVMVFADVVMKGELVVPGVLCVKVGRFDLNILI